MGSPLAAIGAAAGHALSGAAHAARAAGKGLEFAGQLDLKLQFAGNVPMPMAFIVNHIAGDVASAVAKATGNQGNANAQSTLQRALASALAPPGTSPPGSGPQLAATLQQQVMNLVTRLTEGTNTAGQQSEISGTVLDANSAREIPAQQTKTPTGAQQQAASEVVSSYVQSLLNALSNAGSSTAVSAQTPSGNAGQTAPIAPPAAQAAALPDILARMLVRAANADAQRGDQVVARAVPPSGATTLTPSTLNNPGNAALFDRLIAIVAEQQTASQGGTSDGKGDAGGFHAAPQSQSQSVSQPNGFAAQAANAPFSDALPAAQAPNAAHAAIDPNAVIEQIVKGIAMRNYGSSSEVQLRLQPEHLGNVSLKLTVVGNTITANIVAQNPEVREALMSNQHHLVRSLAEAGLSLGKFSVDVSGGHTAFTGQHRQQHANFGRTITAGGSLLSNEETNWEDQRFGPSITGSPSLMFNYLA